MDYNIILILLLSSYVLMIQANDVKMEIENDDEEPKANRGGRKGRLCQF